MSTENDANYNKTLAPPPDQKRYRTFEDLEVYMTEDQLDELLADPGGLPASTLQRFNALTI